jgi:hypothetical protein
LRPAVATLALVALLSPSACDDVGDTKTPPATVGAPGARVTIVSPQPGSRTGSTVTARVRLEGFRIDPSQVGKPPRQGVGHLHWVMDGGRFDFPRFSGANGRMAERLGVAGRYSPSTTPSITYRHLPRGEHTLKVLLANNDHSEPRVMGETRFRVR